MHNSVDNVDNLKSKNKNKIFVSRGTSIMKIIFDCTVSRETDNLIFL